MTLTRLLLIVVYLAAFLPAWGVAQEAGTGTPEPATTQRHAQVIAQGVIAMPAASMVWRSALTRAVAPEQATPALSPGGFVLADTGTIAVTSAAGRPEQRLAPGEATWLEPGTTRAVVSLETRAIGYYDITLLPAEFAQRAGDGEAAEPFAVPGGGLRDVDLLRDVLGRGEENTFAAGEMPALLLVTSGKVFVETSDGQITELASGASLQYLSEITLVGASRVPASLVVARIGASLPAALPLRDPNATPAATPLATPVAATPSTLATPLPARVGAAMRVTAMVCPVDYDGNAPAADCTEPAAGTRFRLAEANGSATRQETDDAGNVAFSEIAAGAYTLSDDLPGQHVSTIISCRNIFGDKVGEAETAHQLIFALQVDDDIACAWYFVPSQRAKAATSLTVHLRACPEDAKDRTACADALAGTSLSLFDDVTGALMPASETEAELWRWDDLEQADYTLHLDSPPEGFVGAALDNAACCSASGDFAIHLPAGFPAIERNLYLFPAAEEASNALSIAVLACPPGMSGENLQAALCLPAPPGSVLSLSEGGRVIEPATAMESAWTWAGLMSGNYALLIKALPQGFDSAQLGDPACCGTGTDLTVTLGADVLDDQRPLFLFQPIGLAGTETDSDADGLTDTQEAELELDPFLPDSDGDGLSDGDEVNFYGVDPLLADTDSDGLDDLAEVTTAFTNPFLPDTDGDGVDDATEVAQGTDPLDSASLPAPPTPTPTPIPAATPAAAASPTRIPAGLPTVIPGRLPTPASLPRRQVGTPVAAAGVGVLENALDNDGLSTLDEIAKHGTSPTVADTDGDGMNDGDEVAAGRDPRDPGR